MGDGCDRRFKARWTNNFGGETTDVNKSLSPPHDFIEKKIVFTKVRIYLYIVL